MGRGPPAQAFGRNGLHVWPTPGSVTRTLVKTNRLLPSCTWLHLTLTGEAPESQASGAVCSGTTCRHPPPRPSPRLSRKSVRRPRAGLPFPARRASFWQLRDVPLLRGWRRGSGVGGARLQAPGVEPSGTHFQSKRNGGIQGSEFRSLNDLTVQFNSSTNISPKTLNKDLRI